MTHRSFFLIAVLMLVLTTTAPAQQSNVVPPADKLDGEWVLVGGELVTLDIRSVTADGRIVGIYRAKDPTGGAIDQFPVEGKLVGMVLEVRVLGVSHPGYTLTWSVDTLRGHLTGMPGERRTFERRLPFV